MSRSIMFTATYKNGKTLSRGCHRPGGIEYESSMIPARDIRIALSLLIAEIKDREIIKLTATIQLSSTNSKDKYPPELIIPMNPKNIYQYNICGNFHFNSYCNQYTLNLSRLVNIVYATEKTHGGLF